MAWAPHDVPLLVAVATIVGVFDQGVSRYNLGLGGGRMTMQTDEGGPVVPPPLPAGRRSPGITVGRTLSLVLAIWFRNLIPFFLIALLVHSPLLILAAFLLAKPVEAGAWLTFTQVEQVLSFFLLARLVTGTVTFAVVEGLRGRRASLRRCLSLAVGRLPVLVMVATVAGILNSLPIVLGLFGLDLQQAGPGPLSILAILGLIIWLYFFVAEPVVMVERPRYLGLEALQRSAILTAGNRVRIFGLLFVLGLLAFALVAVVTAIVVRVFGSFEGMPAGLEYFLLKGMSLLILPLFSVMQAVVYYELRMRKEGVDLDEITGVFD